MKLYIAGPMTGVPYWNVPLFERVAAALREKGTECIVPIELDGSTYRDFCLADPTGRGKIQDGRTWGDFLARDVKCIADEVDGVVMLPDWYQSKGARLEVFVAIQTKKALWDVVLEEGNVYLSRADRDATLNTLFAALELDA